MCESVPGGSDGHGSITAVNHRLHWRPLREMVPGVRWWAQNLLQDSVKTWSIKNEIKSTPASYMLLLKCWQCPHWQLSPGKSAWYSCSEPEDSARTVTFPATQGTMLGAKLLPVLLSFCALKSESGFSGSAGDSRRGVCSDVSTSALLTTCSTKRHLPRCASESRLILSELLEGETPWTP